LRETERDLDLGVAGDLAEDDDVDESEINSGAPEGGLGLDVAITRKVVRSKRTTSVALHASAKTASRFESTAALGMSV
jgi:hypothetical protein